MRFQTSETVQITDQEMVLRVLELCLQGVSTEVVRFGDEITLHGLGPSPRSMNRHDKTVLRVKAERDQTVIDADVSFQASALLGEMPQDELVRSKLDQVFRQMKSQLDYQSMPVAPRPAKDLASGPSPNVKWLHKNDQTAQDWSRTVIPEPQMSASIEASDTGLLADALIVEQPEQTLTWHREVIQPEQNEEMLHEAKSGWLVGVIVFLLLALTGFFYLYRQHKGFTVFFDKTREQPVGIVTSPSPTKPVILPPRRVAGSTKIADPKSWLKNWGYAMQTADANAQASFYADRVDAYMGQRNVTRDVVLRDREATIRMRKGVWTVKMEKVSIVQRTDSEAVVRLVKHFIDEPAPSEIVEWFVPSELVLKRVGGSWKIFSERDLVSSSPPSGDLGTLEHQRR
jgi:ketosteroid isomerase-like protein